MLAPRRTARATSTAPHRNAGPGSTGDPGSYGFKLLFRQTAGTYKDPASGWESVNPNSPDGPNYSIFQRPRQNIAQNDLLLTKEPAACFKGKTRILGARFTVQIKQNAPISGILDTLDDSFKGDDGKFHFKLVWPQKTGDNYNEWKQTTNPVTEVQSVAGYEAVDVKFTGEYWGGLENGQYKGSSSPDALLDGSVNHGNWFYAIGSKQEWHGGKIPGPNGAEQEVELYINVRPRGR